MTARERNRAVRAVLAQLEAEQPGAAARARRIAVYAVATASELGFEEEALLELRDAALGARATAAPQGAVREILALCHAFDSLADDGLRSVDRAVAILAERPGPAVVEAFRKVEPLIQPVREADP